VNFQDAMQLLMERCPGARGAAIVDPDGIPVVVTPEEGTLEALGTEFAAIVGGVDRTGREFHHGGLQQLSVYAENAVVILTSLAAGYFLVLVLNRDGLAGKGRFLSRLTGERLHSEFV
jgi:predicted regulator of Ras-like GTPase activity (Roadblock/LC7/MglB family)